MTGTNDKRFAPEGAIWVCAACGKTHSDQYGIEGEGSRGWDESCALNSVLCHESKQFNSRGELVWWPYSVPLPERVNTALSERSHG